MNSLGTATDCCGKPVAVPLLVMLMTATALAADAGFEDRFSIHGELKHESAMRLDHGRELTKLRHSLLLTEHLDVTDQLQLHATQRAYYDAVFALTGTYPGTVQGSQEWEVELRDTYVDYSQGPWDVRLGKQQVVWGDAVGLFFADTVNAKDLREYILPDFHLIRIPQWGVDVEWSGGGAHVELVWLPVREFHRLGVNGSEYEFPLPVAGGTPTTLTDPSKPPRSVSNSEVGGRLSYLWQGWDVSGFYLYTWDKFPTLARTISGGVYNFLPSYRRAHLIGASFSKAVGSLVFKGEGVLNPRAALPTLDAGDPDGVLRRTVLDYLLGVDFTLFGQVDANVQVLHRVVSNFNDRIANEKEFRTHLSLWLKTELFGGKIAPELLVIQGLSEEDVLLRPKLTVNLTDSLRWKIGADVFQGEPTGLFGRFDQKSRVYTELTWLF